MIMYIWIKSKDTFIDEQYDKCAEIIPKAAYDLKSI